MQIFNRHSLCLCLVGCAGLDKSQRTLCSSHPEVCEALNVTVTPGPVARVLEGDNVTLSCQVAQRRRPDSVLVVRWLFAAFPANDEQLIVKLNMRGAKYYGNYTKRFARPKLRLLEERREQAYGLLILNVSKEDRGHYVCRVQEIRLHQNRWRAASNGTATAELKGNHGDGQQMNLIGVRSGRRQRTEQMAVDVSLEGWRSQPYKVHFCSGQADGVHGDP